LHNYGFNVPDPELHQDGNGRWVIGEIDWSALKATQSNVGEDSSARVALAQAAWEDTAWVRTALHLDVSQPFPGLVSRGAA
jgi:hypothetical protein